MKILLIGNGGREHAIAKALKRSAARPSLVNWGLSKNPGLEELCEEIQTASNWSDTESLTAFVKHHQPDWAIIGPDDPIGVGIADFLKAHQIPTFAPTKKAAQLESSKGFTRHLLQSHGIEGSPEFLVSVSAGDEKERKAFFEKFHGKIVVKADGLLGGKGVLVAGDHFDTWETAEEFAQKSIQKFGQVVLEEKLEGEEFSYITLVDGDTILSTPLTQDHKRAYVGDTGPNTGGMGTISFANQLLPFVTAEHQQKAEQITQQVMKAVEASTGERFCGVMYGGFMVNAQGVKLIEYNARFGDPEALNILSLLKTDLVDVLQAALHGDLKSIGSLEFEPHATVVKYLCPEGYPDSPRKNAPFTYHGTGHYSQGDFFFGSVVSGSAPNEFLMLGSRTIGVIGWGDSLLVANEQAEKIIADFKGPLFHRPDIGSQQLLQKRLDHLQALGI